MKRVGVSSFLLLLLALIVGDVGAARLADIRNTKHNFSSSGSNTTKATGGAATLPATVGGGTKSVDTTQVCVYCHTPHASTQQDAADVALTGPLWNRRVSAATTYPAATNYTSSSFDSVAGGYSGEPRGSSKLCLSCHDGLIAIGNVGVISGVGVDISGTTTTSGTNEGIVVPFSGVETGGTMTKGPLSGATDASLTGFTRRLGTNMGNDHPISVTYNTALANADGEMRTGSGADPMVIGGNNLSTNWTRQTYNQAVSLKDATNKPLMRLEPTGTSGAGQVQCGTCHDPHIRDDSLAENVKFLRGQRLQQSAPLGGTYLGSTDIVCLACHDRAGTVWSNSAHATDAVATQVYKRATTAGAYNAAGVRDLPTTVDTAVWKYACLNCHDTHTVPGARRLLREGVEGAYKTTTVTGQGDYLSKDGSYTAGTVIPSVAETCFMCHRARADKESVLNLATQTVPDVRTDFLYYTIGGSHVTYPDSSAMPMLSDARCSTTTAPHNIGDPVTAGTAAALAGKDFVEKASNLGAGVAGTCDVNNTRHVECTDCHNPHRLQKGNHAGTNGGTEIRGTLGGNAVSNVLKGTFGVEPTYPTDNGGTETRWGTIPTGFDLKCGSGTGTRYAGCNGDLTSEYQICLKCHSNYAYADVNDPVGDGTNGGMYNYSGRPLMGRGSATTANKTQFTGANTVNLFPNNTATRYTNQSMEFWGPASHKGEDDNVGTNNVTEPTHTLAAPYALPDHRSWHPVMTPTGRTAAERGIATAGTGNFRAPFAANLGAQTMYCSDCHGSESANATDNNPGNYTTTGDTAIMRPWGPHGSKNAFILKGKYDNANVDLCLKCHLGFSSTDTGFWESGKGNLHTYHPSRMSAIKCNNCHIAVPHGWKHKALLADTNTVGNEVGNAADTVIAGLGDKGQALSAIGYTQGPYYLNSFLKVTTWKVSRNWSSTSCNGGVGTMKGACMNQ